MKEIWLFLEGHQWIWITALTITAFLLGASFIENIIRAKYMRLPIFCFKNGNTYVYKNTFKDNFGNEVYLFLRCKRISPEPKYDAGFFIESTHVHFFKEPKQGIIYKAIVNRKSKTVEMKELKFG